jgi:hypothetical protein
MKKLLIPLLLISSVSMAQDRLSQMISPAFHPVTFEDPRNISEARLIYVHHAIDDAFVTEGGDVNVYALQLRYAINEDLAIIATKDGYVDFNPNAALKKDEGWADLGLGAKYALYRDNDKGQIVSAALRYIIPTGDEEVLQGQGDGIVHPSVSAATALTNEVTLTAGTGFRIPVDGADSTMWDADVQVDYRVDLCDGQALYPLLGVSMVNVADGGRRLPIADEGQDFFDFGSTGAEGETMVIGAAGARYRLNETVDFGAAYQFPFDKDEGTRVLDYRWTIDAIARF